MNSEMHWEAVIERVFDRVQRCTVRTKCSEHREALEGRNRLSLEMHWEAMIERVWRCTGRP